MSAHTLLAIDAGQTGVKVRVIDGDRVHELTYPGIRTRDPLEPQLADVARSASEKTATKPEHLVAGLSGLSPNSFLLRDFFALAPEIARVSLAHDSVTSFLGALGAEQGSVIAAGGGVVTLAVGPKTVRRIDGWGYIMGDAGSGFWIGREALVAVMRAYDGRGPETQLTEIVRARWPEMPDAYLALQSSPSWVSDVAGFAADVARLAAEDEVARSITRRAAAELAHSAVTGLTEVAHQGHTPTTVCAIGGIFRSALLYADFVDDVSQRGGAARAPKGHGLDGVAALASLDPSHPLTALVLRADAKTGVTRPGGSSGSGQ